MQEENIGRINATYYTAAETQEGRSMLTLLLLALYDTLLRCPYTTSAVAAAGRIQEVEHIYAPRVQERVSPGV